MAKKKTSPYIDQATLSALVRYGPELRGLQALMSQAQSSYQSSLGEAAGQRQQIQQSVKQAQPQVSGIYDKALGNAAFVRGVTDQDLAKLGPVQSGTSQAINQAIALERANTADQLTTAKAANLTDLTQQGQRAVAGEQYARQQAGTKLQSDIGQIGQQLLGVLNEQGAYTASTAGDLQSAAAKRAEDIQIANAGNKSRENVALTNAQSRHDAAQIAARSSQRIARIKARQSTQAGREKNAAGLAEAQIRADAKGGAGGSGGRSLTATGNFANDVSSAVTYAQQRMKGGDTYQQARQLLVQGRPAIKTITGKDGKIKRLPGTGLPAIPKTSDLSARVALDLAYHGQLTRSTYNDLRKAGYSLKALGYPVAPPKGTAAAGANSAGGLVGTLLGLLG